MSEALSYKPQKGEKIGEEYFVMSPSANPKHGMVIANLVWKFRDHLEKLGIKKCKVFSDTIDVHFEDGSYVIPDVSIICDIENIKRDGFYGVPKLVVEVISPSSIKHDTERKFKLYEEQGVPEFWLVDYNTKSVTQCILENSKYKKEIYVLLDEYEFKLLNDKDKEIYTTKFKTFEDLEIDLKDVFE